MIQKIEFFGAKEIDTKPLTLDLVTPRINLIKTTSNNDESTLCNSVSTVSKIAELELLQSLELHINAALHNLIPVIFDTGTSLVITGKKSDFLPNTYQEVHSLKLGGMATGTAINGVGDVAWTFGCNNGDQLSILTKRYSVRSANTRLLSPQKLLEKRTG